MGKIISQRVETKPISLDPEVIPEQPNLGDGIYFELDTSVKL
jgi:hypothetical protein